MKLRIDIDCSPEEARQFFGLPPVAAVQEELMQAAAARMREALAGADPEALMKAWMPSGLEGWERLQKMFWGAAGAAARPDAKE